MKKGVITATLIVLSLGVGTIVGAKLERSKIQESNKSALNENINELNNENKSGEKETLVDNTSYNQKISARKAIENLKYTDNGDCNIREYETIKEGYNFNIDSLLTMNLII